MFVGDGMDVCERPERGFTCSDMKAQKEEMDQMQTSVLGYMNKTLEPSTGLKYSTVLIM